MLAMVTYVWKRWTLVLIILITILVSKCLKNEAPLYLKNKTQYLSDANHYTLRNVVSEKLQIPKAKTEIFKKTFTHSGLKLYNELPFSIR
jgi:ABC-type microcin C transport system permease subunit YejE